MAAVVAIVVVVLIVAAVVVAAVLKALKRFRCGFGFSDADEMDFQDNRCFIRILSDEIVRLKLNFRGGG